MPPRGIKKSLFAAVQAISDADTFDFVTLAGENFKVTKADLVSALGFIGSIGQQDPGTGVPILDIQGTVNIVRALVNGPGVKAELDNNDRIKLSQNFNINQVGVPLISDLLANSPEVASLIQGDGIKIVKLPDGSIEITNTEAAISTSTVKDPCSTPPK